MRVPAALGCIGWWAGAALLTAAVAPGGQDRTGAPAIRADVPEINLQFGDLLLAEGRYGDAADSYRRALTSEATGARAGAGLVLSLLRTGDFDAAHEEAGAARGRHPDDAGVIAAHGDALWAAGLFEEADAAY